MDVVHMWDKNDTPGRMRYKISNVIFTLVHNFMNEQVVILITVWGILLSFHGTIPEVVQHRANPQQRWSKLLALRHDPKIILISLIPLRDRIRYYTLILAIGREAMSKHNLFDVQPTTTEHRKYQIVNTSPISIGGPQEKLKAIKFQLIYSAKFHYINEQYPV